MTAQTIIYRALREVGRLNGAGQTASPEALADGLDALNGLIDAQNIQRGNILNERADLYTLAIGKQAYTIGVDPLGIVTADFQVSRPIRLSRVNVLLTTGSNPVYRKVRILTPAQWGARQYRRVESIPFEMYPDYADPISTWQFYPYPDQAYQIEVWSWQQVGPIATLATALAIPPGYYEYYLYSLALRLASPYQKEISATTMALYQQARADVMSLNAPSPRQRTDGDLNSAGRGLYNWMDGLVDNE
jgi:hypothetical protein